MLLSMSPKGAYYNEIDLKAAAWLRELITWGLIAPGDVDTRSITDVSPSDLAGYTQCHFFAGIGGWSYALRLAQWPDDRPVWTGSCPCQPFSAAGKRGGTNDARHLWPEFHRLIRECRPTVVFGEQVASKDGLAWLDIVSTDMEGTDYAIAAADMCAAGVGAPHIRQRLYFVAHGCGPRVSNRGPQPDGANGRNARGALKSGSGVGHAANATVQCERPASTHAARPGDISRSGEMRSLADASSQRFDGEHPRVWEENDGRNAAPALLEATGRGVPDQLEHATGHRWQQRWPEPSERSAIGGRWACDFIPCTDGKARPVEPGTFPLAHGIPHRVGLLRGYGNAIVPEVAAEFIGAYLDITV